MDQRVLDYAEMIPSPGPKFNICEFYIKAAISLDNLIGEYLQSMGIVNIPSLDKKIKTLKLLDNRSISNKVVRALHSFRRARNEYAHNMRVSSKAIKIERRFISTVEKACKYNGRELFPVSCHENLRQLRLYYAYKIVWENIKKLAKPKDDFYPTREILNAMLVALQNTVRENS